jgi:hypothetical protein
MQNTRRRTFAVWAIVTAMATHLQAQHHTPPARPGPDSAAAQDTLHAMPHEMTMVQLGGGWMAIGMSQAFPTASLLLPSDQGWPLERKGLYLTQPALMVNLESPASRVVLRTTLNFEGITQPGGELTPGAWGEGFLDKRHPHTFLHEAIISLNHWRGNEQGLSLSAGKGFPPFGTDDPMMRPVLKYPLNHHLSQILERWLVSGIWSDGRWSVEAGVFGGNEPDGPFDFSNIESFPDSWSARLTHRIGTPTMAAWPWEVGASFARVRETHDDEEEVTTLYNVSLRHERDHDDTRAYALLEASMSDPQDRAGFFSILAEGSLAHGPHKPYGRVEYATRPEFQRDGLPDSRGFFRYDHDADPIGATRWLTIALGYGYMVTSLPVSVRPYIETQFNHVAEERGGIEPDDLFGRSNFWSLSAGFRLYLGGEPMRMGTYGVLDPMTAMHRLQMRGMTTHRH